MSKKIPTALLGALLTAAFLARASADPTIDPKARAVIEATQKYIQSLKSYSSKVTTTIRHGTEAQTVIVEYAMTQPNKYRWKLTVDGDEASGTICDGKHLYNYSPPSKSYMIEDAPVTLGEIAMAEPLAQMTTFSYYLLTDTVDEIAAGDQSLTLGDKKQVDGKDCSVVVENSEQSRRELLFSIGDAPLPVRINIAAKDGSTIVGTDFSDVKVNEPLADSLFTFQPKSEWHQIQPFDPDSLLAAADKKLLGTPAPDFTLKSPEGNAFTLSSEKGKNIVMIDIWATWCGPCRKSLPHLNELVEKYRGKPIRFFAVDQMETSSTATAYLKKENLEGIPLLLDEKGILVDSYSSSSIPRMALIGKDGTIQLLQSGYGPSVGPRLTAAIDKLLAGETLAKEPAATPASN